MSISEQWAELLTPGLSMMGSAGAWEEVTIGITYPVWGVDNTCEYCGNTEVSKYGACIGCGFTQND